MTQIWPSELDAPTRDGWSRQAYDTRQTRETGAGVIGFRRRFSLEPELISLSLILDRTQKAIFDKFYRVTCKGGTLFFEMPEPTTHGWPLLMSDGSPLLMQDGTPLLMSKTILCAWGDEAPVEAFHAQVHFLKSFNIVVMP